MLGNLWKVIKAICDIPSTMSLWPDILTYICIAWSKTVAILIVKKLLFTGLLCHIWMDRNNMALHKQGRDYWRLLVDTFCDVQLKVTHLISSTKMNPKTLEVLVVGLLLLGMKIPVGNYFV